LCAVLAGAASVTAIADWLHDLDDIARARLGLRRGVPATTTIRAEWLIENLVHHVRDVIFREDSYQARTGTDPAVMATLRNASNGFHRTCGGTSSARATRRANRRPHDLITAVISGNPRTQ
jgi:hypothetical protein